MPTASPSATTSTSTRSCSPEPASISCSAGARARAAPRSATRCSRASCGHSGLPLDGLGPPRPPATLAVERGCEDVLDRVGGNEGDRLACLRRQLVEVGLVLAREDHTPEPGALRRQGLLAQPADRQHLTRERDLAGHADVVCNRLVADERG